MPRIDESAAGVAVPAAVAAPPAAHGLAQAADDKPLCKPAAIEQQDAPLAPAQSQVRPAGSQAHACHGGGALSDLRMLAPN